MTSGYLWKMNTAIVLYTCRDICDCFSLYFEMVRCVYIVSIEHKVLVPVDDIGMIIEENARTIFPSWIKIQPTNCRGN